MRQLILRRVPFVFAQLLGASTVRFVLAWLPCGPAGDIHRTLTAVERRDRVRELLQLVHQSGPNS